MARRKKQENRYLLIGLGIYFKLAFILEYSWTLGICLFLGIIALILFIYTKSKKNKLEVYNMAYIDQMNPFQFEEYICNLFKQLSYKNSYCTPKSGDFGADVITQGSYEKIAIQVKKYKKQTLLV